MSAQLLLTKLGAPAGPILTRKKHLFCAEKDFCLRGKILPASRHNSTERWLQNRRSIVRAAPALAFFSKNFLPCTACGENM
jgi:hypothetical protein